MKIFYNISFLTAIIFSLQSCITTQLVKDSKKLKPTDKIINIKNYGTDSLGNIIINFVGNIQNTKKEDNFHIILNYNQLINLYQKSNEPVFFPNKEFSLKSSILRSYLIDEDKSELTPPTFVFECTKKIYKKGWYSEDKLTKINGTIADYSGATYFNFNETFVKNEEIGPIIFLIKTNETIKIENQELNKIAILIEPSYKKNSKILAYLPLTITADAASILLQLAFCALTNSNDCGIITK